jgi:hypothetical protein
MGGLLSNATLLDYGGASDPMPDPGARGHSQITGDDPMNEDTFNMEVRKFLKVVGVTSQREIETAVRKALAEGKLKANATLDAKVVLTIPAIGLEHPIEGQIKTG